MRLLLPLALAQASATATVRKTPIFEAGELNAHGFPVVGYRIPGFLAVPPAAVSTTTGDESQSATLLVFAEARKYSCNDASPHDLVAKRSTNGGASWSSNQLVVEPGAVWGKPEGGRHGGAVYDPTPLWDADTSTVRVFFSYCPARYMARPPIPQAFEMWSVSSTDRGLTWAQPVNLSAVPSPPDEPPWCQRSSGGGGNGIQLQQGPHKGRLLVPGYHHHCPPAKPTPYSHVLYSDAHGKPGSWKYSASFQPDGAEGSLAETGPGELLYVARIQGPTNCTSPAIAHCAGEIRSTDSGSTWDASTAVETGQLPDPQCKNTVASVGTTGDQLVHAGSHSVSARTNVSALFSSDKGRTWGGEVMLWEAPLEGGYATAQGFKHGGASEEKEDWVAVVFENFTATGITPLCSIAVGAFPLAHASDGKVQHETRPIKSDDDDGWAQPPSTAELATVKARFTAEVTSHSTGTAAAQYAASLLTNGTWSDVDYTDQTRGAWKTEAHMVRVVAMAQALPFVAATKRTALLGATVSALGNWLAKDYRNPNWWFATIGIPVDLITVLLNIDAANATHSLSQAQRTKALELMERSGFACSSKWTGANLADVMKSQIGRGLIFGNATAVSTGFARLWAELYLSNWNEDNIQHDGSFHQHSEQGVRGALLAGSYGTVFTSDMLGFVGLASGTSLAMSAEQAQVFTTLLLDGQQWMINQNNQWDWSVIGRGNSGPGSHAVNGFGGHSQYLREIDVPARKGELAAFAACLNSSADPGCIPIEGNRHFYNSDYQVHRRPGWMASVRMYSTRTIAARCVNNQGKRNSHEADGVTNLYLASDGSDYPYEDIFPVWDFHEVAGMTAEVEVPLLSCDGAGGSDYNRWPTVMNSTTQVGGVSDGVSGAAAMNLSSGTLHHVQNFWAFADGYYVHLGAGLACSTESPVVTSLANRLLGAPHEARPVYVSQSGVTTALGNGNHSWDDFSAVEWVWHQSKSIEHVAAPSSARGTAFVPLDGRGTAPAALQVNANNRTGDWSELGTNHGEVTAATLEVQLHYGTCAAFGEDGGKFAYAVVPNVHMSELNSTKGPWIILSNTPELQAVSHRETTGNRSEVIQAVFWQQGTLPPTAESLGLSVQSGMLVMSKLDPTSGSLSLTASDPWGTTEAAGGGAAVVVTGSFRGAGCTPAVSGASSSTKFSFGAFGTGNEQGKSVTVVCTRES